MDTLANKFDGKTSKITVSTLKNKISEMDYVECWTVDRRDTLKSILLQQLPPEPIIRVMNLYSVLDGDGTIKDLEDAWVR